MAMDPHEFETLISKTRMRGRTRTAMSLFFVEGVTNQAECARRCEISRAAVNAAVKRLHQKATEMQPSQVVTKTGDEEMPSNTEAMVA